MTVFQGVVPPGGGNVNNVAQIVGTNLGGISFANNITRATGSPVVGDTLRIVSADVITGYTSNVGPNTIANFGSAANPRQVVAVFAGQGTVTSVTGGTMASASLNSGQVNFSRISQMARSFRHGVCAFSPENPAIPTTSC